MATPLDVSTRKAGMEYHQDSVPILNGADYDSNDSTIHNSRFREMHNLRISNSEDIELRTGFLEYAAPDDANVPPVPAPWIPVAKVEYTLTITNQTGASALSRIFRYDVTALWHSVDGSLDLLLVDKKLPPFFTPPATLPPNNPFPLVQIGTGYTDGEPIVAMTEYQNAIIVTVYGDAVYEVFPVQPAYPPTLAAPQADATWVVNRVGKELTEPPTTVGYAPTTTGDLYIYNASNPNPVGATDFLGTKLIKTDPFSAEIADFFPFPINAKYFRADDPRFGPRLSVSHPANYIWTNLRYWAFASNTIPASLEPGQSDLDTRLHAQTRGWTYRFVNVYAVPDAKGNKRTIYGKPSTDVPVRDSFYAPAQLTDTFDLDFRAFHDGSGDRWLDYPELVSIYSPDVLALDNGGYAQSVPSLQDFIELSQLVRNYIVDGHHDPYIFAAYYLGWRSQGEGPSFARLCPYRREVLISELRGAPMTLFNWTDFPQHADPLLTEIRIYRTAHSEPGDKDNTSKDPLFERDKFGWVGSIKFGESFTDDVVDAGIDFSEVPGVSGSNPGYDGYLKGQFSGQVIRDYNDKLALLNTKTTYRVTNPWVGTRAFTRVVYAPGSTTDTEGIFLGSLWANSDRDGTASGDGLTYRRVSIAYVDRDGNVSDAILITPDKWERPPGYNGMDFGSAIVQIPRGYELSITGVRIYYDEWCPPHTSFNATGTAGRFYFDATTISPDTEAIDIAVVVFGLVFKAAQSLIAVVPPGVAPTLGATIKDVFEPGEVIWSEPGNMYHFPPLNSELWDQHSGGTNMEVVLGRLWGFCESSTHLSILGDTQPELEEETKHVGAISRFACVKFAGRVFFLSAQGIYFAQGSGVVPFPANCSSLVRPYLTERIPGVELMTNARRASMGLLANRHEIFLHIPSSRDLGGSLPHLTVVFKFPQGRPMRGPESGQAENYTFDLTDEFEIESLPASVDIHGAITPAHLDPATFHSERVIFCSESDDTLWASYRLIGEDSNGNPIPLKTVTVDCDRDETIWPGRWIIEKPLALGLVTTPKLMRTVAIKAIMDADAQILTGVRRFDGGYDTVNGHLDPQCTAWPMAIDRPGKPDGYAHTPPSNAFENQGIAPYIRLIGKPTAPASGEPNNVFNLQGVEVYLQIKHRHP